MFVVDTNVLVYAANKDCAEHEACARLLEGWHESSISWFVTWGIVYDFLSVTTHRGEMENPRSVPDAWTFIERLLKSPGLAILTETERHAAIAAMTFAEVPGLSGRHLHDAHTAILMREHGISRIVTCDTGFFRFPFVEVIDPLSGSWEVHETRPGGPNPASIARYGRGLARRKPARSAARGRR